MSASIVGRLLACTALILVAPPAFAAPLKVVDVGAPAVNCIYNPSCKITVTDSVGAIPLPGISGKAILQSRTFTGAPGAPANGMWGYIYRIDLTQAVGIAAVPCVTSLKVNFGPIKQFAYGGGAALADVYVVTAGGLGNVGLASADQAGGAVTFTFHAPVCAGASPGKGDTSFFFGLTSAKAAHAITATVTTTVGPPLNVAARAPAP